MPKPRYGSYLFSSIIKGSIFALFVCYFTSKRHIPCKNENPFSVAKTLDINLDTVSGCAFHSVTFRRQIAL